MPEHLGLVEGLPVNRQTGRLAHLLFVTAHPRVQAIGAGLFMLPVLELGTGRVPGGHESGVVGIGHDTGQLRTQAPQHLWTVPGGRADSPVYAALDRGFACFTVFVGIVLHPRRGIGTVIGE
jgi:hypothetical protein